MWWCITTSWWVFIQRRHLRCLASRRANIVLVFYCLEVVVLALIVDWDGFPVWCDVYWFFHGWRRLRKGCWKSVCSVWFVIYQGAFLIALRILDWDLCIHSNWWSEWSWSIQKSLTTTHPLTPPVFIGSIIPITTPFSINRNPNYPSN